jgi:hypothetical protein
VEQDSAVFGVHLVVNATAAAGLAKTAVDVIKTQRDLYSWVPPVAAFVLSFVILACLFESNGTHIDSRQTLAALFLGSFVAMPLAIGASAVQSAVERKVTDQKVAITEDIAAAQREKLVGEVVPSIAQAVGDAISQGMARGMERMVQDAARQGAAQVIAEAKGTPAP